MEYMSLQEFVDEGFLQEVNRQFFHVMGLALVLGKTKDEQLFLQGIWDGRDDKEGIIFGESEIDREKVEQIKEFRAERIKHRLKGLGFVFEPFWKDPRPLDFDAADKADLSKKDQGGFP